MSIGFSRKVFVGMACTVLAAVALAGGIVTKLEARMNSGASLQGKAAYSNEQNGARSRRQFSVEVQGAAPGSTLGVLVNGSSFGAVSVNALGRGKFELVQGGDNPGQGAIPAMKAGDVVTIGSMSGQLIQR